MGRVVVPIGIAFCTRRREEDEVESRNKKDVGLSDFVITE
jgi:hypothetical protein